MSDPTRTNYDTNFIDEAIRLALSTSQPISQTARELGVKESTLYNWISKSKRKPENNKASINQVSIDLHEELKKLRRENAKLKEEREILKKATQYFAKESR
mgnify:CR=1 FL=1